MNYKYVIISEARDLFPSPSPEGGSEGKLFAATATTVFTQISLAFYAKS